MVLPAYPFMVRVDGLSSPIKPPLCLETHRDALLSIPRMRESASNCMGLIVLDSGVGNALIEFIVEYTHVVVR